MPDVEHRLQAALLSDQEAQALFAWMGPTQRATFVEYLRLGEAQDFDRRLAEVVAILSDRPTRH